MPVVILGDSAYPYPQLPLLMLPYAGVDLSPQQLKYNQIHSSERIVIENGYGQLKGRFRVLLKLIELGTNNVEWVVVACCTLHNFCITEKEQFPEEWLDEMDDHHPVDDITNGDHDSDACGFDASDCVGLQQDGQHTRDMFAELIY